MSLLPPDPIYVIRDSAPVSALHFLSLNTEEDPNYLTVANQEGHLSIWNLKIKEPSISSKVCNSSITWLYNSKSSELWMSAKGDCVCQFDLTEGSLRKKCTFSLDNYLGFSHSSLNSSECIVMLATPGPGQECVRVWDVANQKVVAKLTPSDVKSRGTVMHCIWLKLGCNLYLLITYESGHISLWDWRNRKVMSEAQVHDTPICLAMAPCNERGVCGTTSKHLIPFSITNTTSIELRPNVTITNAGVASCIYRPDGRILAVGGWDHRIRLLTAKSLKPLAVLLQHKKTVECLHYSNTQLQQNYGYILAAGSSDNTVSLWDIYNKPM